MTEPEITDEGIIKPNLSDSLEPHFPWMASFGNDRSVCVRVRTPPPWFYRQMQRLLLGIKWEKHDE